MKEPVWVGRNVVVAFHQRFIAEHGRAGGIRDEGILESTLARPQDLIAYGSPSLFDLAASYAFGLVKNHPFFDGNKRVGFAAAVLFVELNRWRFTGPEVEVVLRTLALAAGEMSEASYADWMKNNSEAARENDE